MASGNGNGGGGRGGRGAALLQLLNNPVRRPGGSGDDSASLVSVGGVQSDSALLKPSVGAIQSNVHPPLQQKATGRGALVQQMLSQQTRQQPSTIVGSAVQSEPEVASGVVPLRGLGRSTFLTQQMTSSSLESPAPGLRSMDELSSALPSKSITEEEVKSASEAPSRYQRMSERTERAPVIKTGSMGNKVALSANYIALKCLNAGVYQYAVSFNPSIDSRRLRYKIMCDHANVIGETKAFDGAILFLPIQLPRQETQLRSVLPTDGKEITVTIKLVKVLPPTSCLQLYNVLFRRIMSVLKMCQVGRNYFLPSGAVPVPQHKLEVWPGYVTAIAEYEGGLMLLTDVSHRVLRIETVLDVISDLVKSNPRGFQDEINKRLIGCMVLTRYNNKTYRIDDIAWDKTPLSSFQSFDGSKEITFVEYYKNAYNKEIRDHQQPLLIHTPKKREQNQRGNKKGLEVICLIPELSFMTGLTDDMRQDYRVMKDLASHTRITPAQRRISLRNFCRNVNSLPEAKAELTKWGLELDTDIMELEGRQLAQEKIILKNRIVDAGFEADWGRDLTRDHVLTAVDLNIWIVISTHRDANKTLEFLNMYTQCARDMGIRIEKPAFYQLDNDRTDSYLREIRAKMNDQTQLIITIFPSSRDDRYNAIKKLCCADCPVPSQVINVRTISQPQKLRSVTQKIALQINCKLGGELWAVKIPTKNLMVCGIDTFHDAGLKRKNSVAGFVASTNPSCTRWYSRVCCQMPGEELVNGLQLCFTASLRKYHDVNHCLPDRIIIYRDGVGDGQLQTVANFEVMQLMECFKNFGAQYQPNLAVIVVQKRINTRILARKGIGPNAALDNPPPGTILDHTVTRREWYDFFLVSQHVRQGTVTPSHYIVVHDTSNWDVDKIQCLTYKMTHLYYNWPGTVRVPAPCQYAHKLAYLVGQNIRKEPSHLLSDRLFFL